MLPLLPAPPLLGSAAAPWWPKNTSRMWESVSVSVYVCMRESVCVCEMNLIQYHVVIYFRHYEEEKLSASMCGDHCGCKVESKT